MTSVFLWIFLIGKLHVMKALSCPKLLIPSRDLAKFIAAERIPCTIDRVTGKGIIETNRPDDKNKQYNDVVKQGDQLITKLQKYGQAVRLRGSERA